MGKISLLDCTLRDGGYVNDWNFGHNNLISIFERLTDSKTDIVEIGFLDARRPIDNNRSILPDTESVRKIWEKVNVRPEMVVGMIDYGTCGVANIQPCSESFLDGIRVIFKKEKSREALAFCSAVKKLGYKVFAQLVSITAYDEQDMLDICKIINDVQPYAVSIVDTYGLLDPSRLQWYIDLLDANLNEDITLGFHAHNNCQLAYANAITFINSNLQRDMVVDGTLFGMGKSAGNAPIELVGRYLNETKKKSYNINAMLEAIEESIKPFYQKTPWGYKTFYYLSASNNCHPSYVEYFQSKENLSISKINRLLSLIEPHEKKLLYDKKIAESIYREYITGEMNDTESYDRLRKQLYGKNILIIGPGKNVKLQKTLVDDYINTTKNLVAISVNYLPNDYEVQYVFVTKMNRYEEMAEALLDRTNTKIIATSNLEMKNGVFEFSFGRVSLLEEKEEIKDNSFLMLLKLLKQAGVQNVACVGMDGYSDKEDNYALPGMEYDFVKSMSAHLNHHIREVLENDLSDMKIDFITFSHYVVDENSDSAAF